MVGLRVAQVSTGLYTGGAETMLERLVGRLDPAEFESVVVSLKSAGTIGPRLADLGIEVVEVGASSIPSPADIARLRRELDRIDADVVQTWALYANVLGGIGARMARSGPIAWGVHHSDDDLALFGRRAIFTQRLEKRLATRLPARIVACSQSSFEMMRSLRYPMGKVTTIPNGFDLERFAPDPEARADLRSELGIGPDELVVGHVARFHPVKGHDLMLEAAATVAEREPRARFILCGTGIDRANPALAPLAAPLGDRVLLLGERLQMPRIYPAFDLCVSSSRTEALPLAVGEAMACGVPVVATDAGDSAAMVGDSGRIVPLRDPEGLAAGILELLQRPRGERERLGALGRERIERHYSLERMTAAYGELWTELAAGARGPAASSSRR